MGKTPRKTGRGMTLIEVMIAMVVVIVGVLGAMMYRYSSALDARKADIHLGAERVALLVLESWKGAGGRLDFDPSSEIGLENELGPSDVIITKTTGGYKVQLTGGTGAYYYVGLPAPQDLPSPNDKLDPTEVIRELRVDVTWSVSAGSNIPSDFTGRVVTLKNYVVTRDF